MKKFLTLLISVAIIAAIITAAYNFVFKDSEFESVKTLLDSSVLASVFDHDAQEDNYVLPSSYLIDDFEVIYQMPELPTGCEITAMDMILNYYGYYIDKVELAKEYMPTIINGERINDDNVTDKDDLSNYFIEDPTTVYGIVAGSNAITIAANNYLKTVDAEYSALNISGSSADELYEYVSKGIPVAVWVTICMEDRPETQTYTLYEGASIEWSTQDHGAVLIGYTDTTVTIADPISGTIEYDREQFEKVYRSRGLNAVILQKDN